ncbi:Holliday junction DNA helicase subunit RuvA [Scopulibacillus darangshiensis]|uniref:Holliday junction branch migration complex subunit RuvA n=1 Tax=Scopulibacillus darangshiensis TaxID=442528 RepID=A0A4R2PEA0_9BACL|nr:Holliday junction branch migration protein RuvA [Scopulibacillus darangshiensis]TCP32255.1 Holliday junction DNA helicase subunit RuvA [Scopulibacillus darangshiensis]
MIDYIQGVIKYISSHNIVVENNGIGYQIICANPYAYQKDLDQLTTIYTYQYVREDILALYGFKTRAERSLFIQLLSVSGIGPKGGLAILASGQPEHIIKAIENENEKVLIKFPGIGKKTARQIILDLKGKFNDQFGLFSPAETEEPVNSALDEAVAALGALGYSEREIKRLLPKLKDQSLTTEQYIKEALRLMLNE